MNCSTYLEVPRPSRSIRKHPSGRQNQLSPKITRHGPSCRPAAKVAKASSPTAYKRHKPTRTKTPPQTSVAARSSKVKRRTTVVRNTRHADRRAGSKNAYSGQKCASSTDKSEISSSRVPMSNGDDNAELVNPDFHGARSTDDSTLHRKNGDNSAGVPLSAECQFSDELSETTTANTSSSGGETASHVQAMKRFAPAKSAKSSLDEPETSLRHATYNVHPRSKTSKSSVKGRRKHPYKDSAYQTKDNSMSKPTSAPLSPTMSSAALLEKKTDAQSKQRR